MTDAPSPLDWHPAYRDKTWLLDWLERRGPYADLDVIRLPVLPSMRRLFTVQEFPDPSHDVSRSMTMTRRKCWGPAPYVGRPFVYVWMAGVDDLGRCIASDSRIVYPE